MVGDIILIHLSMLLPVYGEVAFDAIIWKIYCINKESEKIEKFWSTFVVRPVLFALGFWGAWYFGDKEWWRIPPVMITAFWAFFPLLINVVLKRKLCHLGGGWWDTLIGKMHCLFRIWFFIWLYITMLCIYYYYELYYNLI